jgi:uncharacterized protein YjiK
MVLITKYLLNLFLLILLSSCSFNKRTNNLKLDKIFEVETHHQFEPSGLTEWDGVFYTVSDKHDYIYKLNFKNQKVELEPYISITNTDHLKFDFEGITHDKNNFYLVSEKNFKILVVSKDGKQQNWLNIDPSLEQIAKQAGLFKTDNAYLEGICVYYKNNKRNFIMVAERQPRGFLQFSLNKKNQVSLFSAYVSKQKNFHTKDDLRSADFSGLSCENDSELYVLNRNAYSVIKLKYIKNKFIEVAGWSYKDIILQPEFQFEDMEYGHAEGLVVLNNKVYLILDNNKSARRNDANNRNSLFLELTK